MTPARIAAYRVLLAVFRGDDLPRALSRIRDKLPDERDRALVTEISTGTVRWLSALDRVIERNAHRRLDKIDCQVLTALRLGVYQLLYLDRVPRAAAVFESVEIVKRMGLGSAAAFVNAVLRAIASQRNSPPLPQEPQPCDSREALLSYLSVTCSHPRWLVERWLSRNGFRRTLEWVRFNNSNPPLTLRANRLRTTVKKLTEELNKLNIQTSPTRFSRDGLIVTHGNPIRTPLFDEGLFVVQDEASQLVAELVAAKPNENVLDVCAAPGGKTTAIAATVGEKGSLIASDVRPLRIQLLRETLRRTGATMVKVLQLDLLKPLPFTPIFDCVVVDAPCSGLGVIRREPEIKWRRQPKDLTGFTNTQLLMIRHASAVVRPGGRLIYSTCSSEPEENEEVVDGFLADHKAFEPEYLDYPSSPLENRLRDVINSRGHLSTTPDYHGLENFFGAVLRRRS